MADTLAYSVALQRAIEHHCRGLVVPPEIERECPHHADMLNIALEQDRAKLGEFSSALRKIASSNHAIIDGTYVNLQDFARNALLRGQS